MNQIFKEYIKTKNKLNKLNIPYFEDIKVGNVISMKLYHMKANKSKYFLKKLKEIVLRLIMVLFFESYELKKLTINNESKILLMYSVSDKNRQDMKRLFNNVCDLTPDKDIIEITARKKKRFILLNIKNTKKIYKIYKSLETIEYRYEKIILSLMLTQILEIKEKLIELDINKYKLFITFCDIFEQDNYLVQEFKKRSIPTATLQHGQAYCKSGNEDNDDLEYENFTADFKLSWGKKTMEEMIKGGVDKNKIINVGNPKYCNNIRTKKQGENNRIFGIVLNNPQTISENIKMIKDCNLLSNEFNLKYCIKLHPSDDIKNYIDFIDNDKLIKIYKHEKLEEYLEKVYFSIANYSSIYMELFYYYHPTLLYLNKFTKIIYEEDFNTYKNVEELEYIYKNFVKNLEKYDNLIINKSHYYIEENVEKNIKDFIESFI